MQLNKNYIVAIKAAIDAGRAIMDIYGQAFEVKHKQDGSPFTRADRGANDLIMKYLLPTGIPVISEENSQIYYEERKEWQSCWIVDPLDGTKEFIEKNDDFTVNIAFVFNGAPQFGVIYLPVTKVLYYGDVLLKYSRRSIVPDQADIEEVLKVSEALIPGVVPDRIRIVVSRSHTDLKTRTYINALKDDGGREIEIAARGSSLKFCQVAEGSADVYPRLAPTMEWDTAAGHAICKAAGVVVTEIESQMELRYNKKSLINPDFVVHNSSMAI